MNFVPGPTLNFALFVANKKFCPSISSTSTTFHLQTKDSSVQSSQYGRHGKPRPKCVPVIPQASTPLIQPTAPRSPFQNGVRTNGRAFNSANWRMKSDEKESPRTNTSRSAFSRPGTHVPQALSDGRRLYVGNMPYTAKSEDLEALFSEYPMYAALPSPSRHALKFIFHSERIDIAVDPFTGRNPSYCFVDLTTKEQAERAMAQLDGHDLQGRPVRIKPGVAKSADDQNQQQQQRSSPFGQDRWRRSDQSSPARVNTDSSRRVYVGGLPRVADAEGVQSKILTFFHEYNVYVSIDLLPSDLTKTY